METNCYWVGIPHHLLVLSTKPHNARFLSSQIVSSCWIGFGELEPYQDFETGALRCSIYETDVLSGLSVCCYIDGIFIARDFNT